MDLDRRRGASSWLARAIIAAVALTGVAHAARAEGPQRAVGTVTLTVGQCPARWEREIRRALEVEVGDRLAAATDSTSGLTVAAGGETGSAANQLAVSCDGARAVVAARHPTTDRRLERAFALEDLPEATAPRIVALAGLELLATLDPELRQSLGQSDRATDFASPDSRWRVFGGGVYRTFASADSGVQTWGAEVGVSHAVGERVIISGGLEGGRGRRTVNLGDMTALLGSGSLAGGMRFGDGGLQATLELGGRGGVARLSGRSSSTDVVAYAVTRPWAGPFAAARVFAGYRWLCFHVSLESGVTAIGASGLADDRSAFAARGVWLSASVGAGVRL